MLIDKYKHISFDLDGTLVHTLPEYRYAVVPHVVSKLGGKINSNRAIDRFWFEPNRNEIIKTEFQIDPMEFWTLFKETDKPEERYKHTFAYPDAEPALRAINKAGKIISVITGSPAWIAEMEIKKLNGAAINLFLPMAYTEFLEKPHPGALEYALEKLECMPEETLYVGNSNEDASFAKNARVDFLYLERKAHEFDNWDWVTTTIHSLDELLSVRNGKSHS